MKPADNEGEFFNWKCRRANPCTQSIAVGHEQDYGLIVRNSILTCSAIRATETVRGNRHLRGELVINSSQPHTEPQNHIACHGRIAADEVKELLSGQGLDRTVCDGAGGGAVIAIFNCTHLTEPLASLRMSEHDRDAANLTENFDFPADNS